MNLDDCTVTLGDQKVHVTSMEISSDMGCRSQEISIQGRIFDEETVNTVTREYVNNNFLTISGNPYPLVGHTIGDDNMSLAKQYVKNNLDEETKLLQDEGVVGVEGTLTSDGEALLLNVLMNDPELRAKVVAAVKEIKASRKNA